MRAASCFSGIGAPELAGEEYDWAWCAEVEKFPSAVLVHRFPQSTNLGDVTVDDFLDRAHAFGPLDLLVGGPPCQAFSVAGLRKSLGDHRGNLSLRFLEIAHAIRPRNLLVENVPGWLNTPDNAFGCFLAGLVGADDALCTPDGGSWPGVGMVAGPRARAAWRVFDAQYFGVAQRRRRVFLVADFGNGADPAEILFVGKSLRGNPAPRRETGKGTSGDVSPSLTASGRGVERTGETRGQDPVVAVSTFDRQSSGKYGDAPVASTVSARDYKGPSDLIAYCRDVAGDLTSNYGKQPDSSDTALGPNLVDHSLRGEGFDASEDGTGRGTPIVPVQYCEQETAGTMMAYAKSGGDSNRADNAAAGYMIPVATGTDPNSHVIAMQAGMVRENPSSGPDGKGWRDDDVAYTIEARAEVQAVAFAQNGVIDQWAVRRLTPTECARLQGFPDDFCRIEYRGKIAVDGPIYKALGNSWAVPCGRWIISRLAAAQSRQDKAESA